MPKREADKKGSAGCLTVIVIIALGAAAWFGYRIYTAQATHRWAKTKGTIVESSFKVIEWDGQEFSGFCFEPLVAYEYIVGGLPCRSRGIYLREVQFFSKSDLDRLLARFAKGTTVDVFYCPDNPSQTVLIPGIAPTLWTCHLKQLMCRVILGLAVLALCGLFAAFCGLFRRRQTVPG